MERVRAVVVAAVAIVACGDRTPRPPRVDAPEEQRQLAKLTAFIDCIETHSTPTFQLGDLVRAGGTIISATPEPAKCLGDLAIAKTRANHPGQQVVAPGIPTKPAHQRVGRKESGQGHVSSLA